MGGAQKPAQHDNHRTSLQKLYREKIARQHAELNGYGNRELPAFRYKLDIIDAFKHNKALALGGETGSGKSTQIPQFLLDVGRVSFDGEKKAKPFKKIFILVPRKNIADGLHERLISELAEIEGEEKASALVGITHGDRTELPDDCVIEIMTSNTYLLRANEIQEKYADEEVVILADEIHEANLFTDVAFAVAAKSVDELDKWRLAAISATHNIDDLDGVLRRVNNGKLEVLTIEGRPFTNEVREAPTQTPMEVYADIGAEHQKTIIFTSGKKQIEHIIDETRKLLRKSGQDPSRVVFYEFHGDMTKFEQDRVNDPIPPGKRAVIVATPAAMSGRTFPGTTLVVTDGTINRQTLNDDTAEGLPRELLSVAEIIQQMGRAGRDVGGGVGVLALPVATQKPKNIEGRVYEDFKGLDDREPFGPPEILHSNLSQLALSVAALGKDFNDILEWLPTRVSASPVSNAKSMLSRIGALNEHHEITDIGMMMNRIPLRPELSRGVVEAFHKQRNMHQLARMAIAAAALDTGGIQSRLPGKTAWTDLFKNDGATDDLEAQLKLLVGLPKDELDRRYHIRNYDLSELRIERSLKVARKIMRVLGINPHHINLGPATPDEYDELRDDMTAGMLDLLFRQTVTERKVPYYQNILGNELATKRVIGRTSMVDPKKVPLIFGSPRDFTVDRTGEIVPVLIWGVKARPEVVAEYARQYGLGELTAVESVYQEGRVVETAQKKFGGIMVGDRKLVLPKDCIPRASQQKLFEEIMKKPGASLEALREVANELLLYRNRVPDARLRNYIRRDCPQFITEQMIKAEVRRATSVYRDAHLVDMHLGKWMYSKKIEISTYLTDENRLKLMYLTPDELHIEGLADPVDITYSKGHPYIIGKPQVLKALAGKGRPLMIGGDEPEDRVEVMVQLHDSVTKKKKSVSAATL